jgi:hypothetical protein
MEAPPDNPPARSAPISCGVVGGAGWASTSRMPCCSPARAVVLIERDEVAAALADAALVIESVPEDLDPKTDTFRRVAGAVPAGTVIASNTSSISLELLADAVPHLERVIGLHFFNPVRQQARRNRARQPHLRRAAAAGHGLGTRMGQDPHHFKNAPGFASSRLGVAIGLEAIRMLEEGVTSAEDIDAAMTLRYGFPDGTAPAHRPRRARCPPGHRPPPGQGSRAAVQPAPADDRHGGARRTWRPERPRLLRLAQEA